MGLIDTNSSINSAKNPAKLPKNGSISYDLNKPEVPMTRMCRGTDNKVFGDYNSIDEMESSSSALAKIEMWLAKAVGTKLVSVYPGRQWGVQVNAEGGILIISCASLSTDRGYHIHMHGENVKGLEIKAVRAAGEILERYNVSRKRVIDEEEIENMDRDWQDRVVSPDAETKETL